MIEEIGKPLLVSAMYESKKQYFVACFIKYEPLEHFTIESMGAKQRNGVFPN